MKSIFILIFSFLTFTYLCVSCTKYGNDDCDYSIYCNPYPLDSGYVKIQVSYNDFGPGVPVALFEGYVEDNNLIWYDTVYQNEILFWLENDKRYSVEAYYKVGNQYTIALDGKVLREKSFTNCEETCYEEREITLDVRNYNGK